MSEAAGPDLLPPEEPSVGVLGTEPGVEGAGVHPPGHTACPRCHHSVDETRPGPWLACDACGWSGRVFWFSPTAEEATVGVAATPDDAVCAHHPGRKAEEVCVGSGAYLCPLCAVRLQGRVFDVEYVEAGGVTDLEKAMQRELPRPDRHVIQLTFLPVLFFCVGPICWVAAVAYGVKHFRLRREDPLYRRVASHGWVIFATGLSAVLAVLSIGGLLFAALEGYVS